ncbi:MAG: hypothetical protein ACWGQW_10020 [bacterium]
MPTLGDYRKLSISLFGEDSKATKYLDEKIKEQGEGQEVIAEESQVMYLLVHLHSQDEEKKL